MIEKVRRLTPEWVRLGYRTARGWFLSLDLGFTGPFPLPEEERKASEAMSVIVAVHDAPLVTHRCLSSLEKFGGNAEIIIVDDGSRQETVKRMLDDFCARNRWRLLRHDKPLGHSRASEAGVAAST